MKNFINTFALILTLASASQAGDCRIVGHPEFPPPTCEIRPVYRPIIIDPCPQPIPQYDQWTKPCRIRVCEPTRIACQITPHVEERCHRCGCQVCQCHIRPVCTIRICKPVRECRLTCHPVTTCRIRPCDHPIPMPAHVVAPEPPPAPVGPVYPEEPAAPATGQLPEVAPGQQVTIDGANFGFQPGVVTVQVGGMQLQAQVVNWSDNAVQAILPQLPLSASAAANVAVVNAQGQVANQLDVMMVPSTVSPQQVAQR